MNRPIAEPVTDESQHGALAAERNGKEPSTRETAALERSRPSALGAIPRDLRETFHRLVARLSMDPAVELPKRIAVVAAVHREGVTTLSRTLAAVLADDRDARVCLVDFGPLPQAPGANGTTTRRTGIADVLAGESTLADALRPTADSRLKCLSAGGAEAKDARGLARSPKLVPILEQLDELFDFIVFDVPPILAGSESLTVARHADAYLMVVRHASTSMAQLRAADEQLHPIPSLGVVINQSTTKVPRLLRRLFSS